MANIPSLRQTYADNLRFFEPETDREAQILQDFRTLADSITYNRPFAYFIEDAQPGDQVYIYNDSGVLTAKLAQADTQEYALGFVSAEMGVVAGMTGEITLLGNNLYKSGLTPGTIYYLSDTPGQITDTAPSNPQFVGIALSDSTLFQNFGTGFAGQGSATMGDINTARINLYGTGVSSTELARRAPGQVVFLSNTSLISTDSGKTFYHPASDTSARTLTIPANSSVPFPVSTKIRVVNMDGAGVITIPITSDTLYFLGTALTGTRTLATNSYADLEKVTATEWIITGIGIT